MLMRLAFALMVLLLLAIPAVQQAVALGISSRFGFGALL